MASSFLLTSALLSALLVQAYSASLTTRPPLIQAGCVWNGKHYPEGHQFNPDTCTMCTCDNGTPRCAIADCAPPACVDAVRDPNQCCPVCPNGENCLTPDGTIMKAGERLTHGSMTCSCPHGMGFMSSHSAICFIADPLPPVTAAVSRR